MIRAISYLAASAIGLAACAPQGGGHSNQDSANGLRPGDAGFSVVAQGAPTGPVVDRFAAGVLNGIQARSIAERREYCGYIWQDRSGQLRATPPIAGTRTSCDVQEPQIGMGILASYHTHGAYSPLLMAELPSSVDLTVDFNYGTNGYVSTPSGRVWIIDASTRSTRQLCGRGCVTSDPRYVPTTEGDIQFSYKLNELR